MKLLVTGSAGFIGSALSIRLLGRGDTVVGIDNHNDYYDPKIKDARLERLVKYANYKHYKVDLEAIFVFISSRLCLEVTTLLKFRSYETLEQLRWQPNE